MIAPVMGEGAIATRQVVAAEKRVAASLDCDLFLNLSGFLYKEAVDLTGDMTLKRP